MNRKYQIIYFILLMVGFLVVTTIFFWSNRVVVVHPDGLIALKQRNILVFATLLMMIVVIPVFVLTFVFAWKYHKDNKKAKYSPNWDKSHLLEVLWWGVPLIIIIVLSVVTWVSTHELDPYKAIESDQKPLTIQVVALEWKWLFIYPEEKIASVNYFQIPKDRPVEFEITADAPMNSFWIPAISGQIFAMPKMRTKLNVISDKPGKYRGSSANLSGKGFAEMTFITEVAAQETFDTWVSATKKADKELDWEEYLELAKPSTLNETQVFALKDNRLFDQVIEQYLPEKYKPLPEELNGQR